MSFGGCDQSDRVQEVGLVGCYCRAALATVFLVVFWQIRGSSMVDFDLGLLEVLRGVRRSVGLPSSGLGWLYGCL